MQDDDLELDFSSLPAARRRLQELRQTLGQTFSFFDLVTLDERFDKPRGRQALFQACEEGELGWKKHFFYHPQSRQTMSSSPVVLGQLRDVLGIQRNLTEILRDSGPRVAFLPLNKVFAKKKQEEAQAERAMDGGIVVSVFAPMSPQKERVPLTPSDLAGFCRVYELTRDAPSFQPCQFMRLLRQKANSVAYPYWLRGVRAGLCGLVNGEEGISIYLDVKWLRNPFEVEAGLSREGNRRK